MTTAIIIFGAAIRPDGQPGRFMRERVEAALALGRTLDRPLYVPTGGVVRPGPAEATLMADLLRSGGVPPGQIIPEPTARNTIRSVLACRALLRGFAGPVHAATSAYHMPRCLLLLRIAGLRARPCWPATWRAAPYWWLREAAGLPSDALIALWWRRLGRFEHEGV